MERFYKMFVFVMGLLASTAAQAGGIRFVNGSNWKALLSQAKSQGKLIFVDCYASWCGPCKLMESKVYSVDSVAAYFNEHFICIMIQMDTTTKDEADIKQWYADAHDIGHKYRVDAYPTFLFISPEGELVHKGLGFTPAPEFLALGRQANDPNKRYFTLLKEYKAGARDTAKMIYLAGTAPLLKDSATEIDVIRDLVANYFVKLDSATLYCSRYLMTIYKGLASGAVVPGGPGFDVIFGHELLADSILGSKGMSRAMVEYAISKAEIYPRLWRSGEPVTSSPDWDRMKNEIRAGFGDEYATHAVSEAKLLWYKQRHDWPGIVASTAELLNRYGNEMDDYQLDMATWDLFRYGQDTASLRLAVKWISVVLLKKPSWANALDTYANLLYKLGDTTACMLPEEQAVQLAPKNKEIAEDYRKMKSGVPTWPLR